MKVHEHIIGRIVSPENLFAAWGEFQTGKSSRVDVMAFERNLEVNIFALQRELEAGTYRHGPYSAFTLCDPKQRQIHKATVRDRVVHHAIFSVLNPIFEPTFIAQSFSCRKGKGTHRAVDSLERMLWKVSKNHRRPCFALKCDIHKFFASVDHALLLGILGRRIADERTMALLTEIIGSFSASEGKGIPIGNLTSQLFANVYMNEFDQFMKQNLKIRNYIRYTDDFIIVGDSRERLLSLLPTIGQFLREHLCLALHPHKVTLRKYGQGIDFLGYVALPHYRAMRTTTKRRMLRKIRKKIAQCQQGIIPPEYADHCFQSYLGVLSHADTHRLSEEWRNQFWFGLARPAAMLLP